MDEAIQQSAKEESLKATMKSCKNKYYNAEYVLRYNIYILFYVITKICLILILISRSDGNIEKELMSNFIIPEAHRVILEERQDLH